MSAPFWQRIPQRGLGVYLALMSSLAVLIAGAGYLGAEILLAGGSESDPTPAALAEPGPPRGGTRNLFAADHPAEVAVGQKLFLKNCAQCHGADARGDEGPNLHGLDWNDEQIATRIRNGKKGRMTAFAGKFSAQDINEVVTYLRTLKYPPSSSA